MSNEDLVNHNFSKDELEQVNEYTASDVQWSYVNDSNNGNYSNGWVNFSGLSAIGGNSDTLFDFSQAYVQIFHGVVMQCDGNASFGSSNNTFLHNPTNAFAIDLNGSHHIIDLAQLKFGGANVTKNSNYLNLMINENLKKKDDNQSRLLYDIMNHAWDSADSYRLSTTLGDVNNQTRYTNANGLGAYTAGTFVNQGRIQRMQLSNFDNTGIATNTGIYRTGANNVYTSTALNNTLQTGLIGCYRQDFTNASVEGAVAGAVRNRYLVFQFVSVIPLCELHDFYKQLPSVQQSLGFELRLQLNVATGNSWTIACTSAAAGATHTINSVSSNQPVGNSCPYTISHPSNPTNNAANYVATGLAVTCPNTEAFNIVTRSFIGYFGDGITINANGLPTGQSNLPARIWVPKINLTPSYSKMLLDNPIKSIQYNDYYVDNSLLNVVGPNAQIQRLYNSQLAKVRNIYIVPYLAPIGATSVMSLQSILTSANQCSLCRLSSFQISVGGMPILSEPLQFNNQFYLNNLMPLLANQNGNSFKSDFMSGQISRSMWEKAYNVYSLDLRRVQDEVQDNQSKSFQLQFKVDTRGTYNFLIIMTFQNQLTIDRITGQVTSA
jgi:hypothetical protein